MYISANRYRTAYRLHIGLFSQYLLRLANIPLQIPTFSHNFSTSGFERSWHSDTPRIHSSSIWREISNVCDIAKNLFSNKTEHKTIKTKFTATTTPSPSRSTTPFRSPGSGDHRNSTCSPIYARHSPSTPHLHDIHRRVDQNRISRLRPVKPTNKVQFHVVSGREHGLMEDELHVKNTPDFCHILNQSVARRQHRNHRIELGIVELEILGELRHVAIPRDFRANNRDSVLQPAGKKPFPSQPSNSIRFRTPTRIAADWCRDSTCARRDGS